MPVATNETKAAAKHNKLFRAIVVLGAAMTAGPGCGGEDCCKPQPPDSSVAHADGSVGDAGVADTPVDVVLIL
jgi:hypothetical protein